MHIVQPVRASCARQRSLKLMEDSTMHTQRRNWMSTALALASMTLVATGEGPWSPDPDQARLGRTKAVSAVHEVGTSKSPVSGEQALLGQIAGNGARASAAESQKRITADFALLGR